MLEKWSDSCEVTELITEVPDPQARVSGPLGPFFMAHAPVTFAFASDTHITPREVR